MAKKYRIVREAEADSGRVRLTFQVIFQTTNGDAKVSLYWDSSKKLAKECCSFQEYLAEHIFPFLTEEEIRETFGVLPLDDNTVKWYQVAWWGSKTPVVTPPSRHAVRKVTQVVTEWVKKGMERCQALQTERGMENWLWETATAEPPEFRWRPAEE